MSDQEAIKNCIKLCWECRHHCQQDLYTFCLQEGGEHVAPDHVKYMADCIQICQTAADFMTRQSDQHAAVCAACAEICRTCEKSCRQIGMDDCADICRQCADSCDEMSREQKRAA